MSSHTTDGIAELVGQIVEDLFKLLVRESVALKWSAAERQRFGEWLTKIAETYFTELKVSDSDFQGDL